MITAQEKTEVRGLVLRITDSFDEAGYWPEVDETRKFAVICTDTGWKVSENPGRLPEDTHIQAWLSVGRMDPEHGAERIVLTLYCTGEFEVLNIDTMWLEEKKWEELVGEEE